MDKPENSIIGGFIRDANQIDSIHPVIVEVTRADEASTPNKEEMADRLAEGPAKTKYRTWPRGKGRGNKKGAMTILGLRKDQAGMDPLWDKVLRASNLYRKTRNREMYIAHGYVSAGVGALLATASLALAGSRYLYEKMSETGDISLLKQASQLADSARQNELAAWELCARESVTKRKHDANTNGVPWLRTQDGNESKRGRKPKTLATDDTMPSPSPEESLGDKV